MNRITPWPSDRSSVARITETIEIRPRRRGDAFMVLGCVAFVAAGVAIALTGEALERVIGVVVVVFFGWALAVWIRRRRDRLSIVLSERGLRPATGGEIPWEDLEDAGVVKYKRAPVVGVRLRSTDRFVKSFTPEELRLFSRRANGLRVIGGAAAAAQLGRGEIDDEAVSLVDIARDSSLASVAGTIAFSRKTFGYDWAFGWIELDRPPEQFAALLREYRDRATVAH